MSELAYLDGCLRDSYIYKMLQQRFEVFKSQDPENGHFDVTFVIEGKKLYANKFILTSCSETLKAMISDRWSNKDEDAKIEAYSYDNFYQFLCFLYSGYCELTPQNVFQLTDMSEFYAVPFLKEFCHIFLSSMIYNVETIEEMVEFSEKYSLDRMKGALKEFVKYNLYKIINNERFLSYKKSVIEFIVNSINYHQKNYETLFEAVYKWTEHQVLKQKNANDKNFDLLEAVKDELLEKGIFLSPDEFKSIYERIRRSGDVRFCFNSVYDIAEEQDGEKSYFKDVYFLAENQALQKQKMNPNESFNLADSIKADLAKVIPNVEFYIMDKTFVMDFIISKGIYFDIRVSIENNRKTVTGVFKNDILAVSHKVTCLKQTSTNICRFLQLKFQIPSIKSSIKKMKGVDWYLCLEEDGILTLKHHSKIKKSDYLIVEMKSETEFSLVLNKITVLSMSFNNLNAIT
uniref:BTB domain-containing protein n=1 Tax=Panagrolaimus sp. PS1159 TaxID=55785 RepID=A0AC35FWJ3_9BILA